MACLSDELVECLAAGSSVTGERTWRTHISKCPDCRRRIEQAKADEVLIADLRELDRARREIKPLLGDA